MKKYQILLFFFVFFSCQKKENSQINTIFKIIEAKVDKDSLQVYKNTSRDSIIYNFEKIIDPYTDVSTYIEVNNYLNNIYSDNLSSVEDRMDGLYFMSFAFHSYVTNGDFNIQEVKEQVISYEENKRKKFHEKKKKVERKLIKLIKKNNNKFNQGDTIYAIFPMKTVNNRKVVEYGKYPYTLDYSNTSDTLYMTGVLLKKYSNNKYVNYFDSTDSFSVVFKLNIIELSETECEIYEDNVRVGQQFDLPLAIYGRPL